MSIEAFTREMDMENQLKAAYDERWYRLMELMEQLDSDDLAKLSNPFLVKVLPAYRKAKRKVLFVGQETNGWDPFQTTLQTFANDDKEIQREKIVKFLQWMYEDLRYHRKYDHTPFWKGMRRLYRVISPGVGDDGFLHTELVRFDYANTRPPHAIESLLQQEYNVLPMEISALAPDVVIFLTGPYYDNRLIETFSRVGNIDESLRFESIEDIGANVLSRVVHSTLPYHTYRTYHPNYSLHYKEKTIFVLLEKALSERILD
ncbi:MULTISPECIES: hypothetical protein [Paenibacillus]|uniref:hypothetical protein n=1 Tax=Paenibacillus TaxID=44249 RepID=UPI000FE26083|nr:MULTISPECIES: hypothetical protein [Paenibacillus]MCM3175862.1 hypothetical protein [Paenibacillus sp. MER 99-2]